MRSSLAFGYIARRQPTFCAKALHRLDKGADIAQSGALGKGGQGLRLSRSLGHAKCGGTHKKQERPPHDRDPPHRTIPDLRLLPAGRRSMLRDAI
jgi:hypothetical protein